MYKYISLLHGLSSDLVCPRHFHQHRGASFILTLIKVSCREWRTLFSLLWSYFYHPQSELAHMISRLSLSDWPTESPGLSPMHWNLAVVLRGSRPRCTVYIGRWEWDVKQQFLEAWVTAAVWLVFPQPPYGRNFSANTFLSNCLVFVRRELGEGVASLLVFGIIPPPKTDMDSLDPHGIYTSYSLGLYWFIMHNQKYAPVTHVTIQHFYVHPCVKKNCLETSVHTWAWQVRWRV